MQINYMAWLRSRAGKSQENIQPPENIKTLEALVTWLCEKDPAYTGLFSYRSIINASVNGTVVQDWSVQEVGPNDTINFFSPMAGG